MAAILEIHKKYGQGWVRLFELFPVPFRIKNYTSTGEEILIFEPEEGGSQTSIIRLSPVKSDSLKKPLKAISQTLFDINLETLGRGESLIIEALSKSGEKSKILRLTQE